MGMCGSQDISVQLSQVRGCFTREGEQSCTVHIHLIHCSTEVFGSPSLFAKSLLKYEGTCSRRAGLLEVVPGD